MSKRDKTTTDIIDIFDVDESTVKRWVSAGCPHDKPTGKGKPRFFDESEVALWMKQTNRSGKPGRPTSPIGIELAEWKLRKERALALKAERENAVTEGKLVDFATVEQNSIAKILTCRNGLLALGSSLAPQMEGLSAVEIQTLLDAEIDRILIQFAK